MLGPINFCWASEVNSTPYTTQHTQHRNKEIALFNTLMLLINSFLIYGLALAGIPFLLHFLMRAKPKKMMFPALQLIQSRRKTNSRRMRLQHFWLLLLRMLVLALLVFALMRPLLPAANYRPNGKELAILAGIVIGAFAVYWWFKHRLKGQSISNQKRSARMLWLRSLLIVLTVISCLLFVAWPYQSRIAAEITNPQPSTLPDQPVAAVFLFDTSPSMAYRFENETRLNVASEIAAEHLGSLPSGSKAAVATTSNDVPVLFQADRTAAHKRINSLDTLSTVVPIDERLISALELQKRDQERVFTDQPQLPDELKQDRFLREIYIFTDLAASSWTNASVARLKAELEEQKEVQVYLIDVGIDQPQNFGVSNLRLSQETVPRGNDLHLDVELTTVGNAAASPNVELFVQNESGRLVKQGEKSLSQSEEGETTLAFTIPGLTQSTTQGELRLTTSDPLAADDVRYFTVAVRNPPSILLAARNLSDTEELAESLVPDDIAPRYSVTFADEKKLAESSFTSFDVVCLINVAYISDSTWKKLEQYVSSGGSLVVCLGMRNGTDRPAALSYNSDIAQSFLPAELIGDLGFSEVQSLNIMNVEHPLVKRLNDFPGGIAELTSRYIKRFWSVIPNAKTTVVAQYTDSQQSPAILEKVHGKGRTILWTTAVDLNEWNDLARSWSYIVLTDQMMQHLARSTEERFNFAAGEYVSINVGEANGGKKYLLRKPGRQQVVVESEPTSSRVVVSQADDVGQYVLLPSEGIDAFSSGFSINIPASESDLTRLTTDDLDRLLGPNRYSIAQNFESLARSVSEGRLGQEAYSMVLLILIAFFCIEHFVANHFYDTQQLASAS